MAAGLVFQAIDEFEAATAALVLIAEHLPGGREQPAYAGRFGRLLFPGDPEDVRRQFLGARQVIDAVGNVAVDAREMLSVQVNKVMFTSCQHAVTPGIG